MTKPEVAEKRRRRLRLKRLKRRSLAARAYQFSGATNGVQGIVFMEILKITDLPPERNGMTPGTQATAPIDLDSDTHFLRHGPVRGDVSGEEDPSNPGDPP